MKIRVMLSNKNGFEEDGFEVFISLNPEGLMPNVKSDYAELSELYRGWKKENDKNAISQASYAEKLGMTKKVFLREIQREYAQAKTMQEREFQKLFDTFVAENKDLIFQAQCDCLSDFVGNLCKSRKEEVVKNESAYLDRVSPYLNKQDLAISTLKSDDNLDYINSLLSLGYEVKCSSASMVFLHFSECKDITLEEIKKVFPPETVDLFRFDEEEISLNDIGRFHTTEVKGVEIPLTPLKGFTYPVYTITAEGYVVNVC